MKTVTPTILSIPRISLYLFVLSLACFLGAYAFRAKHKPSSRSSLDSSSDFRSISASNPSPDVKLDSISEGVQLKSKVISRQDTPEIPKEYSRILSVKGGVMWFNSEKDIYIVTLGSVHGININDKLGVYDASKGTKVANVEIVEVFDLVSFVKPKGEGAELLNKATYRVVRE